MVNRDKRMGLSSNLTDVTFSAVGNFLLTLVQNRCKEQRSLPDNNLSRYDGLAGLATIHREQGRWKEAEELLVETVKLTKEFLAEEHQYTLAAVKNLAFVL